jgi:hypothetical protein
MKNFKTLIAVLAMISLLGVTSSYGRGFNKSVCLKTTSPPQCSQTTSSWLDDLYSYLESLLTSESSAGNKEEVVTIQGIRLQNHNETLVRDEI